MGLRQSRWLLLVNHLAVLVGHAVHDVDECLVAAEEAVPAGQQVAFQPSLAHVFGEHLHDAAIGGQVLVVGGLFCLPGLVGLVEHRGQAVRRGLVGSHQAEVVGVGGDHIAQIGAEYPGRLAGGGGRIGHVDGVVRDRREVQLTQQRTAVGVWVCAHPPVADRGQGT